MEIECFVLYFLSRKLSSYFPFLFFFNKKGLQSRSLGPLQLMNNTEKQNFRLSLYFDVEARAVLQEREETRKLVSEQG